MTSLSDDYKVGEKNHYNERYAGDSSTIPRKVNHNDIVNENAVQYFNAIVKGIVKERGEISMLDYGCGTGDKSVPPIGNQTILKGIDISDKSISKAMEKYSDLQNVSFEVMDCERTSFPDNSFDLIFDY